MDSLMAKPAQPQTPTVHLAAAELRFEAGFPMHGAGDQVVEGQWLGSLAQLATFRFVWASLGGIVVVFEFGMGLEFEVVLMGMGMRVGYGGVGAGRGGG